MTRSTAVCRGAAVASAVSVLALGASACGGSGAVSSAPAANFTTTTSPTTAASSQPVVGSTAKGVARPKPPKLDGAGTYVYDGSGIHIEFRAVAPSSNSTVGLLQNFRLRTKGPEAHVSQVSFRNESGRVQSLAGFHIVPRTGQTLTLMPAGDLVAVYESNLHIASTPDLYDEAVTLVHDLPATVAPGQTVTTLLASLTRIPSIKSVTFSITGGALVALTPKSVIVHRQKAAAAKAAAAARRAAIAAANDERRREERAARRLAWLEAHHKPVP